MHEEKRLEEANQGKAAWKKWGPYLTERQWGTVREDYSAEGEAWDFVTHEDARSKAYRWGEEGIAGISDDKQHLCFALALWNRKDPIIKERMFGLTGNEGNHGEDVKEYYYYLDNTPTHSYMKMLYKYPQNEFPYDKLVTENQKRGKLECEYELIDTGIFDNDEYFDVFVEYAKADPEDILIKITSYNRNDKSAELNILPQLWFRNTWSWEETSDKPLIKKKNNHIVAEHKYFGQYHLFAETEPEWLFCDNESNFKKLYNIENSSPYPKDGINDYLTLGKPDTINTDNSGTKAALNYYVRIAPNERREIKLRLTNRRKQNPFGNFDETFNERIKEADEFYANLQKDLEDDDKKNIQRQALAGMLWTKQFYYFDVEKWLKGNPAQMKSPAERWNGRNSDWQHLNNADIISMPDKWEYPWYATWDSAFHTIPLTLVDPEFAKQQLVLFTREWYMHPNGQLPAYEWDFGDVNPPVHAWAVWRVFKMDEKKNGTGDYDFLERVFHKLLLNFTWWVNKKDEDGRNIFQGGFLGLDNIGVFDRSSNLPTGGHLDQSDGTSWMAMYSLNLMRIALELSKRNKIYQDVATKFFEHFLNIAHSMSGLCGGGLGLWDEQDEFYYDVFHSENKTIKLKVRSMVGLIPLFAVEVLDPELMKQVPEFEERLNWFLNNRPQLAGLVSRWQEKGKGERRLLSLLRGHRMKMLLRRMLDETEFLSDYGVRALSKHHEDNPYTFYANGEEYTVKYVPAESDSGMFGGNSNWRGPIWFPVNYLIIESLQKFHHYYGDDFKIEYPTNSGHFITIKEAADELTKRLTNIFIKDSTGRRALFGDNDKFQQDENFKDYLFFNEYFHGDNGRGVGASHQTGWTGLIAKLLQPRREEK